MTVEQLEIPVASLSNDEGAHLGLKQFLEVDLTPWQFEYDRKADVVYMRRPNHGPATSFFLPECPEFVARLNDQHELVGLDLVDFDRVLAKRFPSLRRIRRAWRFSRWMTAVPGLRLAGQAMGQGLELVTREQTRTVTAHLCPQ